MCNMNLEGISHKSYDTVLSQDYGIYQAVVINQYSAAALVLKTLRE